MIDARTLTGDIGDKVSVIDVDGQVFRGVYWGLTSEFDTSSGKDEIEVAMGDYYVSLPIDEVQSVVFLS